MHTTRNKHQRPSSSRATQPSCRPCSRPCRVQSTSTGQRTPWPLDEPRRRTAAGTGRRELRLIPQGQPRFRVRRHLCRPSASLDARAAPSPAPSPAAPARRPHTPAQHSLTREVHSPPKATAAMLAPPKRTCVKCRRSSMDRFCSSRSCSIWLRSAGCAMAAGSDEATSTDPEEEGREAGKK